MSVKVSPELVAQVLAAQGVASDAKRTEPYAALTTTVLNAAAPLFAQLPFEQEPAGYIVELRRNAP